MPINATAVSPDELKSAIGVLNRLGIQIDPATPAEDLPAALATAAQQFAQGDAAPSLGGPALMGVQVGEPSAVDVMLGRAAYPFGR